MSARYELRDVGVYDRELGLAIAPGDAAWTDYEQWLAGHNAPDPAPPLEDLLELAPLILEKSLAVEVIAADIRRKITAPSSPSEMASWTEKLRQARAFDGTDASAPMLALEGRVRGTSTADIVARVLKNADDFSKAEAAIAGTAGRHKDAIASATSARDLLAYDVSLGWPFQKAAAPARDPLDLPPPPPEAVPSWP